MTLLSRAASIIFGNGNQSSAESFDAPNHPVDPKLLKDIHTYFETLRGMSVEDSCTEEGLRLIIVSFRKFLKEQKCYNALKNFEIPLGNL